MSIYLGSTVATYNYYAKNSAAALKQQAADPQVKTETAYFQANIGKVKTVDDLVGNYRLFNYAMTAYGLSDMTHAKAYMKKVITSDLSDSKSFANKLADSRFVNFAKAFSNLNPNASAALYAPASADDVVKAYLQQSIEDTLGQNDQGVQLALYFKRVAPTVKSAYGLLGDSALWKVVQTTFGLPESMGKVDVKTQKSIVDAKLKVADLQDPAKLDKLLARFTTIWDATQNVASAPVLQLFDTSGAGGTLSDTVGASLLNLRYGG